MSDFTNNRNDNTIDELWLVQHHPVFTQGQAGKAEHVLAQSDIDIVHTDRGGQVTYHGPGQRVAYVLLDVAKRGRDVRAFVADLERWIIEALRVFNVDAGVREGRVGVWVDRTQPGGQLREDKIAERDRLVEANTIDEIFKYNGG